MKFIVAGGNWVSEWNLMKAAARDADRLDFWGLVLPDHYMWSDDLGNASLDSWTALSYLAAETAKLRLGTLVTPIPLRPPSILAKVVSTLDTISKGRAILGVGAGWLRAEFEAYSEWDSHRRRVDKTEEGLRLILALWTKKKVTFRGHYYQTKNAICEPKPTSDPHPPLLFAGEGHRMLRIAGRYGGICFIPPWVDFQESYRIVTAEEKTTKAKGISEFALGAPSVQAPFLGPHYDVRQYSKRVDEAEKNGCNYFVVPFPSKSFLSSMKSFGREIIPSYGE